LELTSIGNYYPSLRWIFSRLEKFALVQICLFIDFYGHVKIHVTLEDLPAFLWTAGNERPVYLGQPVQLLAVVSTLTSVAAAITFICNLL
jgi:hypothetical protein